VVLEGFACCYKLLPDGQRQIVSYCVPGDVCDLRITLLPRLDCSIGTISPALIVRLSRERLQEITFHSPRLARAFWQTALIEQSIAREWLINVGQRTAFSRAAHLLCEMFLRLRAVGLVQENTCEFPLTQTEIADTLALSTVHVNRTLMELRRSGLITLRDKQLTIHHLPALEAAAGFTPDYLHLEAILDDDATPAA
jgi:CRP-like cAMP-binding protein